MFATHDRPDPKTDTVVDCIPLQGATRGAYKAYYSPDGRYFVTMGPRCWWQIMVTAACPSSICELDVS